MAPTTSSSPRPIRLADLSREEAATITDRRRKRFADAVRSYAGAAAATDGDGLSRSGVEGADHPPSTGSTHSAKSSSETSSSLSSFSFPLSSSPSPLSSSPSPLSSPFPSPSSSQRTLPPPRPILPSRRVTKGGSVIQFTGIVKRRRVAEEAPRRTAATPSLVQPSAPPTHGIDAVKEENAANDVVPSNDDDDVILIESDDETDSKGRVTPPETASTPQTRLDSPAPSSESRGTQQQHQQQQPQPPLPTVCSDCGHKIHYLEGLGWHHHRAAYHQEAPHGSHQPLRSQNKQCLQCRLYFDPFLFTYHTPKFCSGPRKEGENPGDVIR